MFWLLVVGVVVVVFRMMGVGREIEKAEEHVQTKSDNHSILNKCSGSTRTRLAAAAVVLTRNASGA